MECNIYKLQFPNLKFLQTSHSITDYQPIKRITVLAEKVTVLAGLPGTLDNLLCILGSKYISPKLVAFRYSYVKYLSSFSVILP